MHIFVMCNSTTLTGVVLPPPDLKLRQVMHIINTPTSPSNTFLDNEIGRMEDALWHLMLWGCILIMAHFRLGLPTAMVI